MVFSSPVSFKEAMESRAVKALLPTTASSAELARLAPELLERATFSARTPYVQHLAAIDAVVGQILDPKVIVDPGTGQRRAARPGERVNEARARELLRDSLRDLGYRAEGSERGTIRDLASEKRINLIVDTQVGMARGYGWWKQGQSSAVLDQWPAQEFLRVEPRDKPRSDWSTRWVRAGGQIFGSGRMIALKTDPVWMRLSRFGLPYPPFDYGSGMGVADVDRNTAERFGLLNAETQLAPQDRGFNDALRADVSGIDRKGALYASIRQAMGDAVEFVGDVLRFKGRS